MARSQRRHWVGSGAGLEFVRAPRLSLFVRRAWGGVGGWRGARLISEIEPMASPLPSAPPRTVLATFTAHGSPVAWLSGGRLFALRIPCSPTVQVHLPPFAMGPAFPVSDYYGGSVAVGLATVRRP